VTAFVPFVDERLSATSCVVALRGVLYVRAFVIVLDEGSSELETQTLKLHSERQQRHEGARTRAIAKTSPRLTTNHPTSNLHGMTGDQENQEMHPPHDFPLCDLTTCQLSIIHHLSAL